MAPAKHMAKLKHWFFGFGLVAGLFFLGHGCGKSSSPPPSSGPATPSTPAAVPAAQTATNTPSLLTLQQPPPRPAQPRQILYNGLALNPPWPPRYPQLSPDPQVPPYLRETPAVVPIDIGRQLLIDNFIIESSTNMRQTFHIAEAYPANPVLAPDQPWETDGGKSEAIASNGGVWYDQQDKLFKMWYTAAGGKVTCLAVSTNGTNWSKPILDVVKDSNIVFNQPNITETVWQDVFDGDPARRYKLFQMDASKRFNFFFSGDGIHWGQSQGQSEACAPGSTVMYNPVRQVWTFGISSESPFGRAFRYHESKTLEGGVKWNAADPLWWQGVDRADLVGNDPRSQLLGMTVIPYESLLVGLFTLGDAPPPPARPKPNKIEIGFSRDGFHWMRPDRRAFIPLPENPGAWNGADSFPCPGTFLMVGRRLHFYTSGRSATGVASTGLATLRRDGFASMDAETNGVLTTWPVTFTGKFLFVNVDNPTGELRVEILDQDNKVIPPFTKENSVPINIDSTLILANWKDVKDLTQITNKPVRFRFSLNKGSLYSFWVSPTFGGASRGFLAAGGPHYTMQIDSIGTSSYRPLPVVTNLIPSQRVAAADPATLTLPTPPPANPPPKAP
jgi:hypothetical protein